MSKYDRYDMQDKYDTDYDLAPQTDRSVRRWPT